MHHASWIATAAELLTTTTAGRQLFKKLRKIHLTKEHRNWFEETWPALKAHHDTPRTAGLSSHQIPFNGVPLGRGRPLSGDGMAMDANEFFARQETTAQEIPQQLQNEHAKRAKTAPKSTAQKFRVAEALWVLRPRPMGAHRTKTWFTPGEVVPRTSEDTYCIEVGPGQCEEGHESQLRAREPDIRGNDVFLDYTAHEANFNNVYAEQDGYTVKKTLAQRRHASAPGGVGFRVRWWGYGLFNDSWEPVFSLVPRTNTSLGKYVRRQKTKLQVSDLKLLSWQLRPWTTDPRPELSPEWAD